MATAKPFLPGASSLIEQLDTRVLVILRDGRHLLGTLRSLDQFSNLVLEDTYERHIAGTKYADIYLGLYIVRGDSLVLLGQVADDESNEMLTQVEMSEIQNLREKQSKAERVNWDFWNVRLTKDDGGGGKESLYRWFCSENIQIDVTMCRRREEMDK